MAIVLYQSQKPGLMTLVATGGQRGIMTCERCKAYWVRIWNDRAQNDGHCSVRNVPVKATDMSCAIFEEQ